jgi:hypothetical protein
MSGSTQSSKELFVQIQTASSKQMLQNRLLRESPKTIPPKDIMETCVWLRENEDKGKIEWISKWAIRMLIVLIPKGRNR